MCGIVGVFPLNKPSCPLDEHTRRVAALFLHNELLFHTLERGKDATGAAVSFGPRLAEGGEGKASTSWSVLKQPVDAAAFFANDGQNTLYTGQEPAANTHAFMRSTLANPRKFHHVIGHCRKGTTGSEYDYLNNHPILVGNIIGIHNGSVTNHTDIFEQYPQMTRLGKVDSEAIFQLFAETANDRALDMAAINFVTERLEGARAVIAYNRDFPQTVAFFRDVDRPIELAYLPELGTVVLCSRREYLTVALESYLRARLSCRATFPKLSVEYAVVAADEGGIIDIAEEVGEKDTLRDIVPLIKTRSLLPEYKHLYYRAGTGTGSVSTAAQAPSTPAPAAASSVTTPPPPATSVNQGPSTTTALNTHAMSPATLVDLSDYSERQAPVVKTALPLLPASADEGTADTVEALLVEGEDTPFVSSVSMEEKRRLADLACFSSDVQEDPAGIIAGFRGKYNDLLCLPNGNEELAHEIVHRIYPDGFADGFVRGFEAGEETAQANLVESEDLEDELSRLETDNQQLREHVAREQLRLRRAAIVIANLKGALLAALLEGDLVTATTRKGRVLELDISFLAALEHPRFQQVNVPLLEELFTERDRRLVQEHHFEAARELDARGETADIGGPRGSYLIGAGVSVCVQRK